ncbi:hypothetical protein BC832DRAFT_404259 [Gaertneriomyces semiglobifer]|nr:hypothetical protein BC832DRAFT_404259 [Gaertneriomyces semiglobifer]
MQRPNMASSTTWASFISFLLFLIPAVHAQTNCITLTTTSACPAQVGASVIVAPGLYDSPTSFDAFVNSKQDLDPAYVASFRETYACPSYRGLGQRYHIPLFCALMVEGSKSVCNKEGGKPLCKDVCLKARQSLLDVFNDESVCTFGAAIEDRSRTLAGYTNLCNGLTATSADGGACDAGDDLPDAAQCGFPTLPEALDHCGKATSRAETCCKFVEGAPQNAAGTAGANGTIGEAPQLITPSTESSKNVIIGVTAGLGGIFLLAAGAVFGARRWRKRTNAQIEAALYADGGSNGSREQAKEPNFYYDSNRLTPLSPLEASSGLRLLTTPLPPSSSYSPHPNSASNLLDLNALSGSPGASTRPFLDPSILAFSSRPLSVRPPDLITPSLPAPIASNPFSPVVSSPISATRRDQDSDAHTTLTRSEVAPFSPTPGVPSAPLPPVPHRIRKCWAVYTPVQADEIKLNVGDMVEIEESFSDGWARGMNCNTRQTGVFPLACLTGPSQNRESTRSAVRVGGRVASMRLDTK